MVVLLVLAILIAVVIPTYRGARERAWDRVAQLNLRSALIAAKISHSDFGGYGPLIDFTVPQSAQNDALYSIEPTQIYHDGPASQVGRISVQATTTKGRPSISRRNVVKLATLSDNDICWFIWDDDEIGTFYGHVDLDGINASAVGLATACDAANADYHESSFVG